MYLLIISIIILLFFIIGIYCIYYFEIPRYININRKNWSDVAILDKRYHTIPRVKTKRRTVISMTTIPSRLDKIAPTLCSILSQTRRVDEIRLNIPYKSLKGEEYNIPKCFSKFKHIKIYRQEKDLGPSTKLLPTLKDERKSNIIVIDDDMIYGSRLVDLLVTSFTRHQEKVVITYYGCNSKDGKLSRTKKFLYGDQYVYLLFGCGGYILRGDMLPKSVFDYEKAPKAAKYVDDNWISGWLWMNNINVYTLGMHKGTMYIPSRDTVGTTALCNTVNWDKRNNIIVDEWFIKQKNRHNNITD